jgi:hypothetical protein
MFETAGAIEITWSGKLLVKFDETKSSILDIPKRKLSLMVAPTPYFSYFV